MKFYDFKSLEFSFHLNELLLTFLPRPRVTLIVLACQSGWEEMEKLRKFEGSLRKFKGILGEFEEI